MNLVYCHLCPNCTGGTGTLIALLTEARLFRRDSDLVLLQAGTPVCLKHLNP